MRKSGILALLGPIVAFLLCVTLGGAAIMLAIYFLTPADSVASLTKSIGDKLAEKATDAAGDAAGSAVGYASQAAQLAATVVDGSLAGTGGRWVADYVWDLAYPTAPSTESA